MVPLAESGNGVMCANSTTLSGWCSRRVLKKNRTTLAVLFVDYSVD